MTARAPKPRKISDRQLEAIRARSQQAWNTFVARHVSAEDVPVVVRPAARRKPVRKADSS